MLNLKYRERQTGFGGWGFEKRKPRYGLVPFVLESWLGKFSRSD